MQALQQMPICTRSMLVSACVFAAASHLVLGGCEGQVLIQSTHIIRQLSCVMQNSAHSDAGTDEQIERVLV
ncbi:uncharacterized protein B0I36DRAFT_328265 [Microdochium trichocladiopsis]|uniref:Secreted protein n=1 Tax=Microdochium trichocladiopsis TaxID=1682393 RepID=A0A9P9BNX6_9PEZI|nr:uncharacterized protein B0I36DRAFT_328265 [Microdochium trichocladiopsis]KAH7027924.1 hypothetical protein B0I36DRAFT_328265 [Microdochium trichocladiopsis]